MPLRVGTWRLRGRRLYILLGNSSQVSEASECAALEVKDDEQISCICPGIGDYLFVEVWGLELGLLEVRTGVRSCESLKHRFKDSFYTVRGGSRS